MPLTTQTWSKLQHEPLIYMIWSRFLSWTHRSLSFAGRLELIKTIITSINNFWSSAFILPIACLDTTESMCSDFLLCCSPNISYKAKVHGLNVFQRLKGNFVFVLCMICLWFLPLALFGSQFHSHALSGWRKCISICFVISLMGMLRRARLVHGSGTSC